MNALALAPQSENKDIKLNSKKTLDSKSTDEENLFDNIIEGLVMSEENEEKGSFLLSKLISISSDVEENEKILSDFSEGNLSTHSNGEEVVISDLLKVAMKLKDGEDPATFPTESKSLKIALSKPEVVEEFKSVTNIKELLDVAKKNNIEVKNFQFFKEEAALDPNDKKIIKKVKSEEIFKLIEKQMDIKNRQNISPLNHTKDFTKPEKSDKNILQSLLSSKNIDKPKAQKIELKNEKITTDQKIVIDKNEIPIKGSKLNEQIKTTKEITNLKETETIKLVNSKNNFENNIKNSNLLQQNNSELKTDVTKSKPMVENIESTVEPTQNSEEKTTLSAETKTTLVDKTKNEPEVKKTFNTFAQEFKEKVENYKPPLMKIKMELKPAGMGEVDVTLLTRGNNLQVNINSNTNTIAMFMQNQTEFKNSLINMGFSDLQMNFGEQQKKEQEQKNSKNNFNQFEDEDQNEQQDGFEMTIPQYV